LPEIPPDDKDRVIKELSEEKNSLLKIISHDIRGPFNQMFALLQLLELESKEISSSYSTYFDKMYLAVIDGMEMIRNLHDARSIDNGIISLNVKPAGIHAVIRQSIRNFSILSRIKKITIVFNPPEPDMEIDTDKVLLGKVIDAVLSNAVKFSPPGSTVSVKVSRDQGEVQAEISDEGPGLKDNEIQDIFRKYQKLTPRPTMGEHSTGLGMYIARVFTGMLGGVIRVSGIATGGLRVQISLKDRVQEE
jgi:K+-sensing histidine kinase KdpD